jgi:hypothetical protein
MKNLSRISGLKLTTLELSLSLILRPMVSRQVCLGLKAPVWGLRPDFYYRQTVACSLIWDALSDERAGLLFTIAAVFASAVILRPEPRGAHDHIVLSQI